MSFNKIFLLFTVLVVAGCELFDRDEVVPAFIRINSVELITDLWDADNCFDNKVKNVEVFVNGQTIGIYAIGTDIPVFFEGSANVEIFPLVYFAGSSTTLEPHRFIQKYEETLDFTTGEINEIDLDAFYYQNMKVHISEDFEDNLFTFVEDVDEDSLSGFVRELNSFCSGNHVGAFHLTDSSRLAIVTTNELDQIANLSTDQAYLEVDYLSDLNLTFSFYTLNTGLVSVGFENLYFVNPKDSWNRLYINMTDFIRESDADRFQMLISAELPLLDESGDTIRSGSAYLDNIRLISF